jgi:hypothetical protein
MSLDSRKHFALIFDQLLVLRDSVDQLQKIEVARVHTLRGHQTVDVNEAVHLSFLKLQDDIAGMEEVLASIAEATGDIPKL